MLTNNALHKEDAPGNFERDQLEITICQDFEIADNEALELCISNGNSDFYVAKEELWKSRHSKLAM